MNSPRVNRYLRRLVPFLPRKKDEKNVRFRTVYSVEADELFLQRSAGLFSLLFYSYCLMKRKEKPPRPIIRTVMTSPAFAVPSVMSQARGSSGFTSPLTK